jgi:hypothetical protein
MILLRLFLDAGIAQRVFHFFLALTFFGLQRPARGVDTGTVPDLTVARNSKHAQDRLTARPKA